MLLSDIARLNRVPMSHSHLTMIETLNGDVDVNDGGVGGGGGDVVVAAGMTLTVFVGHLHMDAKHFLRIRHVAMNSDLSDRMMCILGG